MSILTDNLDKWVGELVIAIGADRFRTTLSRIVTDVNHDAFERGKKSKEPESAIERMRRKQAAQVVGEIGPLLDTWAELPTDIKMDPDMERFARRINAVYKAMET